ncbi:sensor histidine kinase [Burkholderia thailandensis]|uniref:sensor histidine kinase n=1 Tax=Burkholderia thailandensis TaxID=57975 RepID=UPI00075916D8|nr:HAMP domain-containing sensor histidine kinase [Burkholderia thailandensis]KVG10013.1 histidine kinase [Burkholderia thailandensis]
MDASRHAPAAPGRRWYSTTFRLLTVYAATFSISVMVLLGFIAAAITHDMERETDVVIDWQMIYFDAMPDGDIAGAIHRRLEHERMHTNYYGLFSANGTHIAGDVLAFPSELTTYRTGTTLDHTLKIAGDQVAPVVRAMAEVRANGDKLVLARDLTHILRIREAIINALIGGGVLCLVAGIAGGLALSVRQMSRLKAIRHVTQRIAQGDLGQRLPVGGRDEIDMLSHLVNHMLEEVERLMNEVKGVCDGIAHDLRTPLAHVHTLLAHAAQRADTLDDVALSSLVERARTETDGLLARFRAMLRISEIGTLQRRGGFAALQLEALVLEVGQLFEPLADSRSIQFVVRTEAVGAVHGDRALLFEALSNLVDNALKYTPAGGAVRIDLYQTLHGPKIDVIDNGPGIASYERDAVLQHRYRSERTGHLAGSGLGLSIVSAVIHVHDFGLHIDDARPGTRVAIECWSQTLG